LRPRSRIGRADTSAAIPGCWQQALALHLFAGELAGAAESLAFFANSSLRRLLISPATLHLPKYALALHLFLQNAQRLFDVVIADDYLQIPGSFILSLPSWPQLRHASMRGAMASLDRIGQNETRCWHKPAIRLNASRSTSAASAVRF
jgi:hypothetical protein